MPSSSQFKEMVEGEIPQSTGTGRGQLVRSLILSFQGYYLALLFIKVTLQHVKGMYKWNRMD